MLDSYGSDISTPNLRQDLIGRFKLISKTSERLHLAEAHWKLAEGNDPPHSSFFVSREHLIFPVGVYGAR